VHAKNIFVFITYDQKNLKKKKKHNIDNKINRRVTKQLFN